MNTERIMLHDVDWGQPSSKRHRLQHDGSISETSLQRDNWSWMVAAGVFLIQLLIPTIFSAYGVILVIFVKNGDISLLMRCGLLPPILYITTRSFIDPVCGKIISGQSLKCKAVAIFGILTLAICIAINIFVNSDYLRVFTIGICGGLSSSVVVTQAEAVLYSHFPAQQGLRQIVQQLGLALGYFGVPLLMNGLITQYGVQGSILLYSGIVLQALIGAVLLSPPRDNTCELSWQNRPRTYTIDEMELVEFSSGVDGHSGTSPLLTRSFLWKDPAMTLNASYNVAQTSSPIISLRRKNINGVDILPKIPEESEISEESTNTNASHCSSEDLFMEEEHTKTTYEFQGNSYNARENTLKNLKEKQDFYTKSLQKWRNAKLCSETNEEIKDSSEVEHIDQILRIPCYTEDDNCVNSVNIQHLRFERLDSESSISVFQKVKNIVCCSCCNKLCIYEFYLTFINLPNNIQFYFIDPLINSVKVPYFFPAVLFHTVSRLCPLLFVTFVPYLTKLRTETTSSQEGAFAISVAAFSWLCVLLFSPYLLKSKANTKEAVYFVGSTLLATGLYIVSTTRSHTFFALGCACFGLGHGATLGTTASVMEEELGIRDFIKIQGPLDVISGCFILLISVLLGFILIEENGLSKCLITLSVLQITTNILLILSFFKARLINLRNIATSEWHPGGDFLTPG